MKVKKSAGKYVDDSIAIYKAIFENSIDAILITSPDGGIQSANPSACRLFGSTEGEIIKGGRNGLIDPNDDRIPLIISERARTGSYSGEVNHKRKDGTVFPTEISTSLFKDAEGRDRSIIIIRDLTRKKLAEESINRSVQQFRMLVKHSPAGIYMTDETGKCTYVNEEWCTMAGMKPKEAYGDGWINAIHPNDRVHIFNLWNIFVGTGKSWNLNYRIIDKKGNIRWVYGISKPVIDSSGRTTGFIGTNTDITNRKSVEEKQKVSEEKYRLLAEQSGVGVGLYTTDGKILFFNNKALENIGGKLEDYLGKSFLDAYGKKSGTKYMKRINEVIRLKKNFVFVDNFKSSSGNLWLSSSYSRVCNSMGDVIGIQIVSTDITERKNIEEQLLKSTNDLRELTRHMIVVREEDRARIARDLHDDLGQKLTALNMDISWLKSRIGVQSRNVESKLQNMVSMMNDTIESVQKISHGLRPSILDDLGLLPALELQIIDFHKTSGIKCSISYSPNTIEVESGISLAVYRIFQEALTNVARHSGATRVSIKISLADDTLEISVKDNGSGIDSKKIESSKSFGLMGIKERVRSLGGEVFISGRKGEGTRVNVMIPVGQ